MLLDFDLVNNTMVLQMLCINPGLFSASVRSECRVCVRKSHGNAATPSHNKQADFSMIISWNQTNDMME